MSELPFVWEWNVGEKFCVLHGIQNVADLWELSRGISRIHNFPPNACFHMHPDHPKYKLLADNISNLDRALVVSKRVKEFIEAKHPIDVEYLPISIYDHKGKMASNEYFIIHPTKIIDCIDKEKSSLWWSPLDPEKITGCVNLILNKEKLDKNVPLFRPKHMEYYVMIHRDLAHSIQAEGFTGLRFTEIDKFEA